MILKAVLTIVILKVFFTHNTPINITTLARCNSSKLIISNSSTLETGEKGNKNELVNKCNNTSDRDDDLISSYKNAITQDILNRLGMDGIPRVDKDNLSEEEQKRILEMYQRSVKEGQKTTSNGILFNQNPHSVSIFNSFIDNGTRPLNLQELFSTPPPTNLIRIYFPVNFQSMSGVLDAIVIKSATLKLYKAHVEATLVESSDLIDKSVLLHVNIITFDNATQQFSNRNIVSRRVSLESEGWEDFDVAKALMAWSEHPEEMYGFEVVCDERYSINRVVGFVVWQGESLMTWGANNDASSLLPVLDVISQDLSHETRSKRSVGELDLESLVQVKNSMTTGPENCQIGDNEKRCCRFPLYISFADIGWDRWIITPDGVQAYFCRGHCPENYKPANEYATMLSTFSNKQNNHSLELKCVASEFLPLNIAYYDEEEKTVISILENMVPQRCHCI